MTVLVSDSFNRANTTASTTGWGSTDLGNKQWLPQLSPYNSAATTGNISSNQAILSGDDRGFVLDCGISDYSVSVKFIVLTTNPQLIIRADRTAKTYFYVEFNGSSLNLFEMTGGAGQKGSYTTTLTATDIVKAVVNGTTIEVYKNATLAIRYTGATLNQTSTYVGLGSGNGNSKFDDFSVEDFNTGGTPTTQDGIASIIGTGALTSTGRILKNGSASLLGTGTLSATATKLQNALASMVGTGTLTATPVTIKNGQASIVGQGLLVGNADTLTSVVFVDGSVDFKGNGLLTTNGITLMNGNVTLQGQGIFTSEATTVHLPSTIDGVFNVLGTGFLTVEGEVIEFIKPEIPSLTIDVLVELLFEIENKIELSSEIENTTTIHTDLENKVSLTFNL